MTLVKQGDLGGRPFCTTGVGDDWKIVCLDCEASLEGVDAFLEHKCKEAAAAPRSRGRAAAAAESGTTTTTTDNSEASS